jgi:predicted ATPase
VITALAVENYRSLRRLVLALGQLNVVTGPNGSGKSSLYRALRLLADSARNGAVAALAREGGLTSTLWAGSSQAGRSLRQGRPLVQGGAERSLLLGFATGDFGYAMDLGLPPPALTMFGSDPEIKAESVWAGPVLRPAALLADRGASGTVRIRGTSGDWDRLPYNLKPFDSMLSEVADPQRAPELLALRERIRSWRFYDHLRTDGQAPARTAQIGTRTPVLGHDGADLAAALQTIREIGDDQAMADAIGDADLIGPLADLIVAASASTQIIVVTHAQPLVTALQDGSASTIELIKEDGRTLVAGQGILDEPAWHWPGR